MNGHSYFPPSVLTVVELHANEHKYLAELAATITFHVTEENSICDCRPYRYSFTIDPARARPSAIRIFLKQLIAAMPDMVGADYNCACFVADSLLLVTSMAADTYDFGYYTNFVIYVRKNQP